jgi:hypothetical protein
LGISLKEWGGIVGEKEAQRQGEERITLRKTLSMDIYPSALTKGRDFAMQFLNMLLGGGGRGKGEGIITHHQVAWNSNQCKNVKKLSSFEIR